MIGFVNLCHADYVDETMLAIVARAQKALADAGVELYAVERPVTDPWEGEAIGRDLLGRGVEGVILFMGSWIESPTAMAVVREVEHLPLCLWGFGMFPLDDGSLSSTGSYVSLAMFQGTMDRVGYRFKPVLGLPEDEAALGAVLSFCRAAHAAGRLKRTRLGLVGYTSMGIYPGTFDHVFLRAKIGPEVEQMDAYSVINRAEAVPEPQAEEMVAWLRSQARIRDDVPEEQLRKSARLTQALLDICREKHLDAMNVKCQYEFSKEYGMVACVPMSALAELGVVSSCEGDTLCTVTMAMLHLLTGQTVTYGDAMDHRDGVVKLSSCGFIPFSLGREEEREIRRFMPHPGFKGIQPSFVPRPGPVTCMRLIEDRCDYHLLYFTGEGLETKRRQGYMPALDVRVNGSIDKLVRSYAGQHFAICYGDRSAEVEDLALCLGIPTVRA